MEMITLPKEEFDKMKIELEKLRGMDFELLFQLKNSLEDVKDGKIKRVA